MATNCLPYFVFGSWLNLSIPTYSKRLLVKIALMTVDAYRAYGSVCRRGRRAQSRTVHWPYGASTTLFACSRTFNVGQGDWPEGSNDKGEGNKCVGKQA